MHWFYRVCYGVFVLLASVGTERAEAQFEALARDRAGKFDYYVLSLSWSPEYCAGSPRGGSSTQCNGERQFGFVVHGLWPQYERGYPQSCRSKSRVSNEVIQRLLPIMPSDQLIRHEWKKHGTCSGLTVGKYFAKVEDAYALVTIPQPYRSPQAAVTVAPRQLKTEFVAVNRNFEEKNFALLCKGRFLSEIRVCLDKDLNPRSCGADIRDSCRAEKMILRPVR